MNASSSTTLPTLEDPDDIEFLDLSPRDQNIRDVLAHCFGVDREFLKIDAFLDRALGHVPGKGDQIGHFQKTFLVAKPVRVSNAFCDVTLTYAELAAVLYGPVSRLVDRCLEVDDEWAWDHWSGEKMDRITRELFTEAGIADRLVETEETE